MQRECRDERARGIPRLLQDRRGCSRARRKAIAAVVADPMLKRIHASENARVRGEREHGVGMRELEAHAFRGEAIERRGCGTAAITVDGVSAQGVNRDQKNVLVPDGPQISLPPASCERREGSERENDADDDSRPTGRGEPQSAVLARAVSAWRCAARRARRR